VTSEESLPIPGDDILSLVPAFAANGTPMARTRTS